ncbi:MAG: PspC domain-containing protein [Streptosporangiales bacterium]|nr:PspC domain-containing protein [Streptosporangiales bacterium]
MDEQNTGTTGARKLRRTRDGRIIAGVASGIGAYVRLDANIIRLVLAVATFFGGAGVFIYVAGWLLIPEEGENRSILENFIKNQQNKQSGF